MRNVVRGAVLNISVICCLLLLVACSTDDPNDPLVWGDFVIYSDPDLTDADLTADFPRQPPPITDLPNLEGHPAFHEWSRTFTSVGDAIEGLPPATVVLSAASLGDELAVGAVVALVNPVTDEVIEVQTWYGQVIAGRIAVSAASGSPDLLLYWGDRYPRPHFRSALPGPADSAVRRRPPETVDVGPHRGIYIGYDSDFEGQARERRIRNAVQWTTADGRYWTVQGFMGKEALLSIAEEVVASTNLD